MAKGNPFLGTVSGSFGDLTLKNYRGKQVLTRKSTKPHNPRTSKQIYQRMFFATVGKARAALKNIIDHSFEDVPHGVDSLNYFQKRNIAVLRENAVFDYSKQTWVSPEMNFVMPKSNVVALNPYRISEGSLISIDYYPAIPFENVNGDPIPSDLDVLTCFPWVSYFGKEMLALSEQLLLDIQKYDLKPGDYLTAVFFSTNRDNIYDLKLPLEIVPHFIRYKIAIYQYNNPSNNQPMVDYRFLLSNVDGDNFELPSELTSQGSDFTHFVTFNGPEEGQYYEPYIDFADQSNFKVSTNYQGKSLVHNFQAPITKDDAIVAGCWIHSRPDGDKILTSTQDLKFESNPTLTIPASFDIEKAFELWTKEGKSIGDARYLLEGGDI